ncbi:MAG: hypothetical protein QF662_04960 [Phycisphaerae bacterium]|nr:hypothetical protein [Phycisphaerae bacterium]
MSNATETIRRWLKGVRRRLLFVRAVESGMRAALAACTLAIAVLAFGWAGSTGVMDLFPATHYVLVLIPVGWLIGFAVRLAGGISLLRSASFADRSARLKERLITALEAAEEESTSPGLAALQLEDTEAKLNTIPPGGLKYSRTLHLRAKLIAASAVAIAALAFIPWPRHDPTPATRKAADHISRATKNLSKVAKMRRQVARSIRHAENLADTIRAGAIAPAEAAQKARQIAEALKKANAEASAAGKVGDVLAEQPEMRDLLASQAGGAAASAAAASLTDSFSSPPPAGLGPDERAAFIKRLDEAIAEAGPFAPLKRALEEVRKAIGTGEPQAVRSDALQEALETLARLLVLDDDNQEALARASGALLEAAKALAGEGEAGAGGVVVVIGNGSTPPVTPPITNTGTVPEASPFDTPSWTGAGARAESAIEEGKVRPEHRDVVREYFSH